MLGRRWQAAAGSGRATSACIGLPWPFAARHRAASAAPQRARLPPPCAVATETLEGRVGQQTVSYLGLVDAKYTVAGQLTALGCSAEEAYSILTDFDACSRIFDNITSSEVSHRDDGTMILSQGCRWRFLAFGGEFRVDFSVSKEPEQLRLCFRLLESAFMRDFEGRWHVRQLPGGEGCEVRHELAVMPFMELPAAVESYVGKVFVNQVSGILADLEAELQRRQRQQQQQQQ